MKLKTSLILMVIVITLAFSGCMGIEDESTMHESSSVSVDINELPVSESPVKFAFVNGIEIGYREFGSGKTLLMIMPFATEMDMCNDTFVKHLADSYRVLIFDNRGMGYSSDNNELISISLLVNDTACLMDVLGLDSAHIFGSSMGAVIAQELALEHADKVDRLILSSAACSLDVPQTDALKSILQYRASDPDTDPVLRKYAEANLQWNGTYERLPEIQNKVLLLTANEDMLTPPDISIEMAEQIPDSQLVRFEGAGHLGEQYIPEEYANEILCFLASE